MVEHGQLLPKMAMLGHRAWPTFAMLFGPGPTDAGIINLAAYTAQVNTVADALADAAGHRQVMIPLILPPGASSSPA